MNASTPALATEPPPSAPLGAEKFQRHTAGGDHAPWPPEPEQVNVVVVGHVDHGKSTLIGRLLHDTGSLPDGKLEQVRRACREEGMDFEYAFLLDALLEEQEQNITIDTTRIFFHTAQRDYAIIDAPGHREFLKNMITGAASASAAFLLIDAREGIQEQSHRHAFLLSLLGIEQLVVLINKMDLADYSEAHYRHVVGAFEPFLRHLGLKPRHFIPITARHGDNIAGRSAQTPWWSGPTVVEALDQFAATGAPTQAPARLPLQDVYRFDDRRIFAGRLETGRLKIGERLVFQPGGRTATIKSIERWNRPARDTAEAGESVGLTLSEQIFVERGSIAAPAGEAPRVGQRLKARVFWLGQQPLTLRRPLRLRLATQETTCEVVAIERVVDVATLQAVPAAGDKIPAVNRHEVADLILRTRKPLAYDDHTVCPVLGRFVLVDDRQIAGGGILFAAGSENGGSDRNLHAEDGAITPRRREQRNGHAGGVVWLTGLSGSGKSTIAAELERQLFNLGRQAYWLDGDNLRLGLNADLGFTDADRAENVRRAGEIARLFADAGVITVVSLISPHAAARERVRGGLAPGRFLEVYVNAPLAVCRQRDPKGLYAKSAAGRLAQLTGVDSAYEPPAKPELELRTDELTVGECVQRILAALPELKQEPGYEI